MQLVTTLGPMRVRFQYTKRRDDIAASCDIVVPKKIATTGVVVLDANTPRYVRRRAAFARVLTLLGLDKAQRKDMWEEYFRVREGRL